MLREMEDSSSPFYSFVGCIVKLLGCLRGSTIGVNKLGELQALLSGKENSGTGSYVSMDTRFMPYMRSHQGNKIYLEMQCQCPKIE